MTVDDGVALGPAYRAIFGDYPTYAEWRDAVWDKHRPREGSRLVRAFDGEAVNRRPGTRPAPADDHGRRHGSGPASLRLGGLAGHRAGYRQRHRDHGQALEFSPRPEP